MRKSNSNRMTRINEEIKRELSYIIRDGIKDPRVDKLLTIIDVDTTNDLKYCKVYISAIGNDEKKKENILGLKNAMGFIRKELAHRLNLRNTPELKFLLDDSIEYSIHMNQLLKEINTLDGKDK